MDGNEVELVDIHTTFEDELELKYFEGNNRGYVTGNVGHDHHDV